MTSKSVRLVTLKLRRQSDAARVRQVSQATARALRFGAFESTRLTTAAIELARNAVSHGGGGRFTLSLSTAVDELGLDVAVSDSGSGVPPNAQAAVFSSRDAPRSEGRGGLGLGLRGVRRMADEFDLATGPSGTRVLARFVVTGGSSDLARLADGVTEQLACLDEEDPAAALSQQNSELLQALADRDLLIKETHHRTRNNLAIITSLIRMAKARAQHEETQQSLKELESRLNAIVSVHQQLEHNGDGDVLPVIPFLEAIGQGTCDAFSSVGKRITVEVSGEPLLVPHRTGVDLGLICGELLTNALKYAFADREDGRVLVTVAASGASGLVLRVADDGVGLPEGVTRPDAASSLGWRMIRSMASKYDGVITAENLPGLAVTIELGNGAEAARVAAA